MPSLYQYVLIQNLYARSVLFNLGPYNIPFFSRYSNLLSSVIHSFWIIYISSFWDSFLGWGFFTRKISRIVCTTHVGTKPGGRNQKFQRSCKNIPIYWVSIAWQMNHFWNYQVVFHIITLINPQTCTSVETIYTSSYWV